MATSGISLKSRGARSGKLWQHDVSRRVPHVISRRPFHPGGSIKDRITRSDVERGHPEYYQDLARKIAGDEGCYASCDGHRAG